VTATHLPGSSATTRFFSAAATDLRRLLTSGSLRQSGAIDAGLIRAPQFVELLTIPAYQRIIGESS
jgi:hypothetical protein